MRRKRGPQGSLLWLIYTRVELLWRLELHMTYKDPDRPIYDKLCTNVIVVCTYI